MNGSQNFSSNSSLHNVDLPTKDSTPPDEHASEGDPIENPRGNNSDFMSVEALINKYTSHSRETCPSENCESVGSSVGNVETENLTKEDERVQEVLNDDNFTPSTENEKDECPVPSSPVQKFTAANNDVYICESRSRNKQEDATDKETMKEGNEQFEGLEDHFFKKRQEQNVSTIPGPDSVKPLMPNTNRQTVEEIESSSEVENKTKKKKVSWQVGETKPKKTSKKAAAVFRGSMASTVTTIAGLKRWKFKARQDTQSEFEKYPGHLRVVQEHLRQEKTDTPLTIRQDVKKEVLPILANIVRAYKKELVGEHRLLREATLKYERLKSELQDAFL